MRNLILAALFSIVQCEHAAMAQPAAGEVPPPAAFLVGFAQRDVTPTEPMPMWGYGARQDLLSQGVLDPLSADAIVIQTGDKRLAIVGTDLGRGPTRAMMERIRATVAERAGVECVIISGSHSHHTPVIELTDREGAGRGRFDAAVAYSERLPDLLIEAIVEAADKMQPARIGVATRDVPLNRNRHAKRQPKPTDPMLAVVRFDSLDGRPLAVLVNFAAHPVMTDSTVLKFSADYPGFMKNRVEAGLETQCVFMQGASGDMSPNSPEGVRGPQAFGEALGDIALELARSIESKFPETPSLVSQKRQFQFRSRVDFTNPSIEAAYGLAFFPELVRNFVLEFQEGIQPEMTVVVLNGELALVAGSGEFFCRHATRLKERSYLPHTLFFGYANGHDLYFPTIEGASEGGYGADAPVSPVEIGAGERMMDQALIDIYTLTGKFPPP